MEYSSEESESEHEELESDRIVSLMDRLRTPMPADIARSRKVMQNDPPKINVDARAGMLLTLRA